MAAPKKWNVVHDFQQLGVIGLVPAGGTLPSSPVPGQFHVQNGTPPRAVVYEDGAWRRVTSHDIIISDLTDVVISVPGVGQVLRYNNANQKWENATLAISDTTGTVPTNRGGTGVVTNPTQGGVAFGASTSALGYTAAGSSGQFLRSAGTGTPVWDTLLLDDIPDAWAKRSVRAATTAAITLSGAQTIDGISVSVGDRVLVKNQGGATEGVAHAGNGIYIVSASTWSRASDADSSTEVAASTVVVDSGTVNGGRGFDTDFKSTDTLGTTGMAWHRRLDFGMRGVANGVAALDGATKVPIAQLPATNTGTADANSVVRADHGALINTRTPTDGTVTGGTAAGTGVKIAGDTIRDFNVHSTNKDGAAATPSMRTLGTGAQQAMPGNTNLATIAVPNGPVNMNGQRLTSLPTGAPASPQDAVSQAYVDQQVELARSGMTAKAAVDVLQNGAPSVGSFSATGASGGVWSGVPNSVDGVTLVLDDRILVVGTGASNGIFRVATVGTGTNGTWQRADDMSESNEAIQGTQTWVARGNTYASQTWTLTTDNVVLNSTSQTWIWTSGTALINAGAALTKSGNTLDVAVDNSTVEVNADALRIKALGVGTSHLADTSVTLTAGAGQKVAGTLPVANGGTGGVNASQARWNIGASGTYTTSFTAVSANSERTVTHNLGQAYPMVQVWNATTGYVEEFQIRSIDSNSIGLTSEVALTDVYHVRVVA